MNKSPLKVFLTRKGGMEIGAEFFCRTVGSLSFQDNEEIDVKIIYESECKQAPLVKENKSRELTRPAHAMFTALFKKFSEDSVMDSKNALNYYRLCSSNLRNITEGDSCLEKFMV